MTDFFIDQQTLEDLQIYESANDDQSVFKCFENTTTIGGLNKLKVLFKNPITDVEELHRRTTEIRFIYDHVETLTFKKEAIDFIEYYLNQSDKPKNYPLYNALRNSIKHTFSQSQDSYRKHRGVRELLDTIHFLKDFRSKINPEHSTDLVQELSFLLDEILENETLRRGPSNLLIVKNFHIEKCDFILRVVFLDKIRRILEIIYELDAYQAAALTTKKLNLTFANYDTSTERKVNLEGVFHLFLSEPIANDFRLDTQQNVCLLTGVNMSGKSTIMKSVAISIYLAHIGFPVPAERMSTSMFNGLLTTINLRDDLSKGYSHFYNEVLRVKLIAEQIALRKNLFIVFDELFRGTNIKDAYESSLLVMNAFSKVKNTFFTISTHITEIAEELNENENIKFQFFKTDIRDGKPSFTYKLLDGITNDRIGLWILKNEGITDILKVN